MSISTSFRSLMRVAFIGLAILSPLEGLNAEAKLRFICVSILPGAQETVLASGNPQGVLKKLGKVDLRASGITDWMPAKAGEMHLAVRQDGAMESLCGFEYPAGAERVLVALVADTESKSYKTHVIDADKIDFGKGSVMVVNLGEQDALVALGSNERKIGAGKQEVIEPGNEEDATYRQLVSGVDDDGKETLCHDRHVPANPDSREMLFILADKTVGIKVVTIPIFGPLD